MDNVKIEISQEDYQSLRNNPNVQIDMEARYFIVGFNSPQPQLPLTEKAPLESTTHKPRFHWKGYTRKPTDMVALRRIPRTGELTGKQAKALEAIAPVLEKEGSMRSDVLARAISISEAATEKAGSYYLKCLIDAGVLGVLRD